MNDGGDGKGGGVLDSYQGLDGETGGGYYLLGFFYFYVLLPFGLSCPVSFSSEKSIIAVVPVSLFIICFLCLRSL